MELTHSIRLDSLPGRMLTAQPLWNGRGRGILENLSPHKPEYNYRFGRTVAKRLIL
jgi:hypothetical protein